MGKRFTIIALTAFCLMFMGSALADAPPCSAIEHKGNNYMDCDGVECVTYICDGSGYHAMSQRSVDGTMNIDFGNDSSTCNSEIKGRLRYDGDETWEYCNGTAWTAFACDDGGLLGGL